MKKKIILIFTLYFTGIVHIEKSFAIHTKQRANGEISKLDENSKERIYENVVLSLLIQYMQKEINNYYKEIKNLMNRLNSENIMKLKPILTRKFNKVILNMSDENICDSELELLCNFLITREELTNE